MKINNFVTICVCCPKKAFTDVAKSPFAFHTVGQLHENEVKEWEVQYIPLTNCNNCIKIYTRYIFSRVIREGCITSKREGEKL